MDKTESTLAQQLSITLFPPTEQLLVAGGDTRISLNPVTQQNHYGCSPTPDPHVAAFASATATSISAEAYFAVNQLRNRIAHQLEIDEPAMIYADEMQRIRQELIHLNELETLNELEIVFAASGTDSHHIVAQLLTNEVTPLRILMVDKDETGRGVSAAFTVQDAKPIEVALRLPEGALRPAAEIDADFVCHAEAAIARGERVLLSMVDVSKTGLIAPSVACAIALHQRYPQRIEVFVDACQYRISPATLRAYLTQGFMVGITGSKFMTGPSFSGALLISGNLAKHLQGTAVLGNLKEYSSRWDWSMRWVQARQLNPAPNFGLLLRWEAAVKELRAFHAVSNTVADHFLKRFAKVISARLHDDVRFEALEVPALLRQPFADEISWDATQTIFPFLLRHADSTKFFSRDETLRLYLGMQAHHGAEEGVQLAQPVNCGTRDGIEVSALRLCMSARLVVEALQHNGRNEQQIIDRALRALDTVGAMMVKYERIGTV